MYMYLFTLRNGWLFLFCDSPWLTLDGYTDRWAFGAAFGATANIVFYLITQWKNFFKIEIPTWATGEEITHPKTHTGTNVIV